MELVCDSRILSKAGILLFTQRHIADFHITVMPDAGGFYRIVLEARDGILRNQGDLQNELLECEFIAARYAETADLRRAVEARIIAAANAGREAATP